MPATGVFFMVFQFGIQTRRRHKQIAFHNNTASLFFPPFTCLGALVPTDKDKVTTLVHALSPELTFGADRDPTRFLDMQPTPHISTPVP
jgi:hypothetical protein